MRNRPGTRLQPLITRYSIKVNLISHEEDGSINRAEVLILRRLIRMLKKHGFIWFLFLAFAHTAYAEPISGKASWYSSECCRYNPDPKCPMANGRSLYDAEKGGREFMASWFYPLGTVVRVCNRVSKVCTRGVIEDRGPNKRLNRLIDLNKKSFSKIADPKKGVIEVTVEKINDSKYLTTSV